MSKKIPDFLLTINLYLYKVIILISIITFTPSASFSQKKLPNIAPKSEKVWPYFATDDQKVYLVKKPPKEKMRVILTGYRYEQKAPSPVYKDGVGRKEIFCGCVILDKESSNDNGNGLSYYFLVPENAPSGEYYVRLLDFSQDCPNTIDTNTLVWRGSGSLLVTPSYIISKINEINILDNWESDGDNPCEMNFSFMSTSTKEPNKVSLVTPLVGTYPVTGDEKTNYITNADNTILYPDLPVFIGRESQMYGPECHEEVIAFPENLIQSKSQYCENNNFKFSGDFQFAINGVEYDGGASSFWGWAAGVLVTGIKCYTQGADCLKNIKENVSLGIDLKNWVNEKLAGDDDKTGYAQSNFVASDWEIISGPQTKDFENGDHPAPNPLTFQNYRKGAPRIVLCSVKLIKVKVLESYEGNSCDEANEIFINTNAMKYQDGDEGNGENLRFPQSGYYSLKKNEDKPINGIVMSKSFDKENTPDSPLLYVEFAAWEDDGDYGFDAMGIHSRSFFLADLLSDPEGKTVIFQDEYAKNVKKTYTVIVNGYSGYYEDCSSIKSANASARLGKVKITYEIDITGLMSVARK